MRYKYHCSPLLLSSRLQQCGSAEGTDDYVLVLYRIVINVLRTPASAAKLNFGVVNVEGGKLKFIG